MAFIFPYLINLSWKYGELQSSLQRKLWEIWRNEGRIHQRGRCELLGFMHKTLLNPLPRAAERWSLKLFLRTDLQIYYVKILLKTFQKHSGSKSYSNQSDLSIAPTQKWFGYVCVKILTFQKRLQTPSFKKLLLVNVQNRKMPFQVAKRDWSNFQSNFLLEL